MVKPIAAFLASAIVLSVPTMISAAPPEDVTRWWNYLEGDWEYEMSLRAESRSIDVQGETSWRKRADGSGVVGNWRSSIGTTVSLIGWRPDLESVVEHGYSSTGGWFHQEYADIGPNKMTSKVRGRIGEDPISHHGNGVCTKVNADKFTWRLDGKDADGKPLTIEFTFTRKPSGEERAAQRVD
jgi:hypothetical protein